MVRNDRRAATSLPGLAGRSRDRSTAARWRTVWPDIMLLDADVAGLGQHRVRGELGAVIADDHLRRSTPGDQIIQLAHHPSTRDRRVDHRRQTLAGAAGLKEVHLEDGDGNVAELFGEVRDRPRRAEGDADGGLNAA